MAPEVARESPYNTSVDVYSFGILLWELCSGEKPFYGYSSNKHMQQVVIGGERPKMDSHHTSLWPTNLQWLMHHCWSPFPVLRPSFQVILEVLQDILDGKESVPPSSGESPVEGHERANHGVEAPPGGFGGFFQPLSRLRAKTSGSVTDAALPEEGFRALKPSSLGGGRSRSWGFGHKK